MSVMELNEGRNNCGDNEACVIRVPTGYVVRSGRLRRGSQSRNIFMIEICYFQPSDIVLSVELVRGSLNLIDISSICSELSGFVQDLLNLYRIHCICTRLVG